MNDESSSMKYYSMGIVALNKKLNSNTIEVYPVEKLPAIKGELTDKYDTVEVEGTDGSGKKYKNSVRTTNTVTATWIGNGDVNLMTSPDVRRGDKVNLYHLGNSNIFYWKNMDNDGTYRRKETVIKAYSATEKENEKMTPDNSYVQGVSTHKKYVTLVNTSKANGEKFAYSVAVDAGNGCVHIKDDIGNRITLESNENRIRTETSAGGFIQIDNTRITSHGEWFHMGPMTIDDNLMVKKNIDTNGQVTIDMGLTAQQSIISGQTMVAGGGMVAGGSGMTSSGDFKTTGDVVAGSVSLKHHKHDNGHVPDGGSGSSSSPSVTPPNPAKIDWDPADKTLNIDYRNPGMVGTSK